MRATPLFIAISIFSVIILFTPGCLGTPVFCVGPHASASTADDAGLNTQEPPQNDAGAAPTIALDGGMVNDTSTKRDIPIPFDVSASRQDGSVSTRSDASASADMVDSPSEHDPQAFLLPSTTCHGRHLPATTPGLTLAERGMILWHLCYKTPTRTSSTHPLAMERPERVTIEVALSDGERLLLATPAPATANPWTISLLIALPVGVAPAFQGQNFYSGNRRLGIVASSDGQSFPTIQGEMRSWRVLRDQSQDEYVPERTCRRPTLLNPDGAFFLPLDMCPGQTCPLLERLECQTL